jgi:hypothetical protein
MSARPCGEHPLTGRGLAAIPPLTAAPPGGPAIGG